MTHSATYKQILERSSTYFDYIGLKPFVLSLPLKGKFASNNQKGIREKIFKNNSQLKEKLSNANNQSKTGFSSDQSKLGWSENGVKSSENVESTGTTRALSDRKASSSICENDESNRSTATGTSISNRLIGEEEAIKVKLSVNETSSSSQAEAADQFEGVGDEPAESNGRQTKRRKLTSLLNKDVQTPLHADPLAGSNYEKCLRKVEETVENLTNPDTKGFVLVLAEVLPNSEFRPVAGGIVELLDEHERSIRGLWCRRSLPLEFSKELVRLLCMVIVTHAFEWTIPGKKHRSGRKLVSTLEETSVAFPNEAKEFLGQIAMLSKHYETEENAGSHNDHPSCRCRCHKLSESLEAWIFWGISESRFIKQWKTDEAFSRSVPKAVPCEYSNYFNKAAMRNLPEALKDDQLSSSFGKACRFDNKENSTPSKEPNAAEE